MHPRPSPGDQLHHRLTLDCDGQQPKAAGPMQPLSRIGLAESLEDHLRIQRPAQFEV